MLYCSRGIWLRGHCSNWHVTAREGPHADDAIAASCQVEVGQGEAVAKVITVAQAFGNAALIKANQRARLRRSALASLTQSDGVPLSWCGDVEEGGRHGDA